VTIHGTSAGASSCHYQCIFPGRRFRRAILSSGTFIGIGPLPLEEHQTRFKEYKEALLGQVRGDDVLSDTVALLQAVSVDRLTSAVQATVFNPLIEEDWIPSDLCERVRSNQDPLDIMVGACAYEVRPKYCFALSFRPQNVRIFNYYPKFPYRPY
jgi:carboxylesterase type B